MEAHTVLNKSKCSMATSHPQEGGSDTIPNNPTLTCANWAADATEPRANPNGLDGHRDDKQVMASHEKVDEEEAILGQTSGGLSVTLFSKKDDAHVSMDQDQTFTEDAQGQTETFYNQSQQSHRENKAGAEELYARPGETFTERNDDRSGTQWEKDCNPQQVLGNMNSEHGYENETNSIEKCLNHNFTSATEETQPETSVERRRDKIGQIVTNIEQGEQLLQRLQDLQLRQDLQMAKCSQCSSEVVQGVRGKSQSEIKAGGVTGREEMQEGKEGRLDLDHKEEDNWMDGEDENKITALEELELLTVSQKKNEDSDDLCDSRCPLRAVSPAGQNKAGSPVPSPSLYHKLSAAETAIEKQVHLLAAQKTHNLHRVDGVSNLADNPKILDTPETANEKQVHLLAAQKTHNLQGVDGPSNLANNPDILEIPFKTDIVLDITPAMPSCCRHDWQFSEQKMRQEISQDIQRELVLVNQGKIPGEYSKGEARQFKETKLLFEAVQQRSIEGPMRRKKSPTLTLKSPVYPTALERTRSLEYFSLKSRPISRAQSLRLYKSNSDMVRNSLSRELSKASLLLHLKEDKNLHLHRNTNPQSTKTAILGTWKTCHSKTAVKSHIQSENPFYKLRPALVSMPEVERDIREAKEREEELHRRRCALYGEYRQRSEDQKVFQCTPTVKSGRFVSLVVIITTCGETMMSDMMLELKAI